jgi:PncC family amidohydrolase
MIDLQLIKQIAEHLQKQKLKIATAESCTAGLLAYNLTTIPGSSNYFERGVITYSNLSKQKLLNIPSSLITNKGAVSQEVAYAMAQSIKKFSQVDIGLSTTGIAGPGGGTKQKPVGLVYIGISTKKTTQVKQYQFTKNRKQNQIHTCYEAIRLLLETLKNW